jgi:hypothetical protein
MLGKKKKDSPNRTSSLGPNLSFLDIVQDACRKGGRFTLTAESRGHTYTVLVDRGGPFNVSGGGLTGSAALATAAGLRDGTYEVVEGWPVDQPLYQLGLDATLKGLLLGGARTEVPDLPPARGVDMLRNAAWNPETALTPVHRVGDPRQATPATATAAAGLDVFRSVATATSAAPPPPPAPMSLSPLTLPAVTPATAQIPLTAPPKAPAPLPTPTQARPTAPAPISAPPPPPAPLPPAATPVAAEAPEPVAVRPVPVSPPAPASVPTPGAGLEMGFGEAIELDAALPGEAGASEQQGQLRHLLTQALLWTVQIEEPGRYTLRQAWILVLRALRSAFALFIDPVERELVQRWARAKEDWRKSGESVATQKPRRKSAAKRP